MLACVLESVQSLKQRDLFTFVRLKFFGKIVRSGKIEFLVYQRQVIVLYMKCIAVLVHR